MFLPYGFFVGNYASGKNGLLTIFLVFLASLSIECTQLAIGRVFDVDDIILNVLGGIIGYSLYLVLNNIYNALPKVFKTRGFLDIASIVLLFMVIGAIIVMML